MHTKRAQHHSPSARAQLALRSTVHAKRAAALEGSYSTPVASMPRKCRTGDDVAAQLYCALPLRPSSRLPQPSASPHLVLHVVRLCVQKVLNQQLWAVGHLAGLRRNETSAALAMDQQLWATSLPNIALTSRPA